MSVHWDRLDVKVAVRYPKSYGPRDGKGKGQSAEGGGDFKDDQVTKNIFLTSHCCGLF